MKRSKLIQEYTALRKMPIGLKDTILKESVHMLNSILADTMTLRDMYKKHHWQVTGPNFYSLHLLFDKHYSEQAELIDDIAERIQMLGGISVAMAKDVLKLTDIESPPKGREDASTQIKRLLDAHEILIKKARKYAAASAKLGDDGTNDLLVSDVLRTNEMQVWFLQSHSI